MKASFRRRQTALNGASSGATFALNVATGIWFTPFLVGRIGPESYGIIMLAVAVVSYGSPLVQGLASTLVLHFARAQAGGRAEPMQRLLDASLLLTLRTAAVLGLAMLPLAMFGPQWLGLAAPFHAEASAILLVSGLGLLVWVLSAPFAAILYTANRIDQANVAQALQVFVRVFGAAILIEWLSQNALWVPLAGLAGAFVLLAWTRHASRSVAPLRIDIARIGRAPALPLGGTEAGVLGYSAGFVALLGAELVIVNYMADELGVGRYAAVVQVAVLLRSAMLGLAGVSGPAIVARSAEGNAEQACRSTEESIRLLGILAALPAGVGFAAAPLILTVWLGRDFAGLADILRASLAGTVIVVAAIPLYTLEISAHRASAPAIVRAFSLVVYVALAVILFKTTPLRLASVPVAFAAAMAVFEIAIMAPYVAARQKVGRARFVKAFGPAALGAGLAWGLTRLTLLAWRPERLWELVLFCAVVGLAYLGTATLLFGRRYLGELVAFVFPRAPEGAG